MQGRTQEEMNTLQLILQLTLENKTKNPNILLHLNQIALFISVCKSFQKYFSTFTEPLIKRKEKLYETLIAKDNNAINEQINLACENRYLPFLWDKQESDFNKALANAIAETPHFELVKKNLGNARLSNLPATSFIRRNFADANLNGADLANLSFLGCDLTNASLNKAKRLSINNLIKAKSLLGCKIDKATLKQNNFTANDIAELKDKIIKDYEALVKAATPTALDFDINLIIQLLKSLLNPQHILKIERSEWDKPATDPESYGETRSYKKTMFLLQSILENLLSDETIRKEINDENFVTLQKFSTEITNLNSASLLSSFSLFPPKLTNQVANIEMQRLLAKTKEADSNRNTF